MLEDRLGKAREHLDGAWETIKSLCELVEAPKDTLAYLRYFCGPDTSDKDGLKEREAKRLALYKHTAAFVRAYAGIANELEQAGFKAVDIAKLKADVDHYEKVRTEVKLASGDYIDLKMYEPAMRHLIDTYIRAEESEKISAFDDMTLIEMIVERGIGAVDALPKAIRTNRKQLPKPSKTMFAS